MTTDKIFTKISGTGGFLPKKVLTNYDLEKMVDTTHDWIVDRSGIESRHIIGEGESVVSMGIEAAKKALEAAQISPEEIDMVLVATCSNDYVFPSAACFIQSALNIPKGPAFDISAAGCGFVYGLSLLDQAIKSGSVKKALLIGSEAMSRVVDWKDRSTCVLFGDGAGAVVLEASNKPGVISTHLGADGSQQDLLYLKNDALDKIHMEGAAVFKKAVNILGDVALKTIKDNNFKADEIDWLVPHQANLRIIQGMAKKLNLPEEKVILTLHNQGNTSAASVPLALDAGIRDGRIKPGQLLMLEVFGGGLTWGSAMVRV